LSKWSVRKTECQAQDKSNEIYKSQIFMPNEARQADALQRDDGYILLN